MGGGCDRESSVVAALQKARCRQETRKEEGPRGVWFVFLEMAGEMFGLRFFFDISTTEQARKMCFLSFPFAFAFLSAGLAYDGEFMQTVRECVSAQRCILDGEVLVRDMERDEWVEFGHNRSLATGPPSLSQAFSRLGLCSAHSSRRKSSPGHAIAAARELLKARVTLSPRPEHLQKSSL